MVKKKMEYQRVIYAFDNEGLLERKNVEMLHDDGDLSRIATAKKDLLEKHPSALISMAKDVREYYMNDKDFIKVAIRRDKEE